MTKKIKQHKNMTPREIANLQLQAYNNRHLSDFCALFDDNAILTDLPSQTIIAQGIEEIRSIYCQRFSLTDLKCIVHSTSDIGDFAIDRETVFGMPDGPVNIVAMYQVKHNKIQQVFFIKESV